MNYFQILLTAFVCLIGSSVVAADADQPNILFIYVDDLGWKDVGFMGSDFYETPNLDRLAQAGMIFTDAYSCAANCAPARACLLSGQYSPRHKIFNVGTGPRGNAKHRRLIHNPGVRTLDRKIVTWASQLKKAGYATATIGKWHLSNDPLPYGFDLNIGGTHAGGPPRGYYPPHDQVPGLGQAPANQYLTDRLSDEAIKFIQSNRDKPWCVYLTHFAVHTPLHPKRELVQKYKNKKAGKLHHHVKMGTMIEAVDQGVGKIIVALEQLKIRDKTIVIFSSDNGGYGPATDMDPLKGYKGTYYEGGIRVPFFVNWPGVVKPRQQSHEPIIGVDLYPTICQLAGVAMPADQPCDGVSLAGLWTGKQTKLDDRALFWHFPAYLQSYKGINQEQQDPLFRTRPCSVIRRGKWKLHQYFETGQLELYDLENDIGESKNLAATQAAVAGELLDLLRSWQTQTAAPIPREKNPAFDAAAEAEARKRLKNKKRQQQRMK